MYMKINIGKYSKKNEDRKIKVHIDAYDVWNLDHTLALIIHPSLIALKEAKGGIPYIHNQDVPIELQTTDDDPHYGFSEEKWNYVLDEMIFSFEQFKNDYSTDCDDATRKTYNDRIDNGLRLFGKYYKSLWT